MCATATAWGGIAVLATTEPQSVRGFVRSPNGDALPFYEPAPPCPAVLLHHVAGSWERTPLAHLPVSHPMLALLPDNGALIVSPRTPWTGQGWNPRNAHVFTADGTHSRALALGDDIEELTVDEAGTIWTRHGEQGWDSVMGSALVRWDVHGDRLWGSDYGDDQEAVNATADDVWSYSRPFLNYYHRGAHELYPCDLQNVRAIAFDNEPDPLGRLLLAAATELDGPSDNLHLGVVFEDDVAPIGPARIIDPVGRPINDWTVLAAHGSRLYLDDQGDGYHSLDVPTCSLQSLEGAL
ncbi:hypothetical protein GCM10029963_75920 [Micromonospora andamanensis]|nr:hypothetical protein Vwe01_44740 [Micromonospora andamanensis]